MLSGLDGVNRQEEKYCDLACNKKARQAVSKDVCPNQSSLERQVRQAF